MNKPAKSCPKCCAVSSMPNCMNKPIETIRIELAINVIGRIARNNINLVQMGRLKSIEKAYARAAIPKKIRKPEHALATSSVLEPKEIVVPSEVAGCPRHCRTNRLIFVDTF